MQRAWGKALTCPTAPGLHWELLFSLPRDGLCLSLRHLSSVVFPGFSLRVWFLVVMPLIPLRRSFEGPSSSSCSSSSCCRQRCWLVTVTSPRYLVLPVAFVPVLVLNPRSSQSVVRSCWLFFFAHPVRCRFLTSAETSWQIMGSPASNNDSGLGGALQFVCRFEAAHRVAR
jgi:hypothetical protein